MSTNSPNNPFSREGAESLAHTVRQAQRAMEEPPLSAVHINQGSADAMADAYDAEYQASRTMTTPPNAPEVLALPIWHEELHGMAPGPGLYEDQQEWVRFEDADELMIRLSDREAALVAEVDLLRRVQASMATEGVALVAERDALAAEVGALRLDALRWREVSDKAWFVDAASYVYGLRTGSFGPTCDMDEVVSAIDAARAEAGA